MQSRPNVLLFILLAATFNLCADELVLSNGDILQGSAGERSDDRLIWQSDNFGALEIPLEKIISINGMSIVDPIAENTIDAGFSDSYSGNLSLTGAYASGNEEREDWDLESTVEWRDGDFRHNTGMNFESHSLNNSAANEEYSLNYNLDWFFQEQWFLKTGIAWGANDNRAIDQFYSVGSALGRQFWETEAGALSAETGLVWVSEEFQDQSSDNRLTWSWAANYRQMLTDKLELFHSHYLRVSLSDIDDSEISADLGLKAPLVSNVFTELKFEWIYDNQPVAGKDPSDSQFTVGVSYSW